MNPEVPNVQGTKSEFQKWLKSAKQMSHSAYSKLPIPVKASYYDEYRKAKGKA